MKLELAAQNERRDQWYAMVRERIHEVLNEDGSGRIPQFDPPYREPVWILPALYSGAAAFVDLANRSVARWFETPPVAYKDLGEHLGREFGIFQSNSFADCLHTFGHLLTKEARAVMTWHTEQVFKTFEGAAQPDYKFHGANDNMPMMATKGLILGGEALGNEQAIRHGVWNLHQVRRMLSRGAWMSDFNSSTYTAVTLSALSKIARQARDAAIRALASQIEHRLWAEILLHYHPATLRQAGPQCRAYPIDYAGHNHSLQVLLWKVFGPDITGRDPIASFFQPDGTEVIHFAGNVWQSIAEYTEMLEAELHVLDELAHLIVERDYPASLRGRAECMMRFDGRADQYQTETYMEEAFSLGTVNGPLCGGEQTTGMYATYKLKPHVASFRDASTIFYKYLTANDAIGAMERSADGAWEGERFFKSQGWCHALQKKNTGLLHCTPNLANAPLTTDTLKLSLVFPAHYGRITRCVFGDGPLREGAAGTSNEIVPVSVEAGEVYVHIQPLLPTDLPRRAALRFRRQHAYEVLELINYEGPERTFSKAELGLVLNGLVMTLSATSDWESLTAFHQAMSDTRIVDYVFAGHRYLEFHRRDVTFELVLTTDPFGVQTEAIDGRHRPRPVFESNQVDVDSLPFMTGDVHPNPPFWGWGDSLEACWFPDYSWLIGSRGLPGEMPYANRTGSIKTSP